MIVPAVLAVVLLLLAWWLLTDADRPSEDQAPNACPDSAPVRPGVAHLLTPEPRSPPTPREVSRTPAEAATPFPVPAPELPRLPGQSMAPLPACPIPTGNAPPAPEERDIARAKG
jgi:hypothetical protein